MSKGIGKLQRRLLAGIEASASPVVSARELVARELEGLEPRETLRRLRSADTAIRRALAGLARRGLLVGLGRVWPGGERRSAVAYALPDRWRELEQAVADWTAARGQGTPIGRRRPARPGTEARASRRPGGVAR